MLAVGGDMSAERLLLAYQSGLYYWHHPLRHVHWWSPDPRIVLETGNVGDPDADDLMGLASTVNADFEGLLRLCQQQYNTPSGMTPAWLSERMARIFRELQGEGLVHSQEVWKEGALAGGFFGICLGPLCFGEYAAGTTPEAVEFAIRQAARALHGKGVRLMDMHKETARSPGLEYDAISRVAYVDLCREATRNHRDKNEQA